jgi:4-cresol dehydrogenase (hydroxylating)
MRREAKKKLAGLGNIHFTGETKSRFARAAVGFFKPFQGTWAEPLVSAFFNTFIHSSLALIELLPELIDIHKGDPNESVVRRAYFRHPAPRPSQNINVPKDGVGVMWFVPLVPFRGAEIEAYLAACKPLFERYKLDYYVTIIMMNSRTTVPLMVLLYQLDDPDSCRRAKGLYDALYKDALSRGYQQFRCGQAGWDKIFTDCPELKHLHETLKKTLDPDGLIAPGRYGIGNAA